MSMHARPRKKNLVRLIIINVVMLAVGFGAALASTQIHLAHSSGALVPVSVPHPHYAQWQQPVNGITLSGLQDFIVNGSTVGMMERQMHAARNYWKANTIRLQILQDRLRGADGRTLNQHYLYFIKQVVNYGIRIGLTVVLNDQTEVSMGFADNEPAPDHATLEFWSTMMIQWANNPHVIFDLFNEPRQETWSQWKNGAVIAGVHYMGMQPLINWIRGENANNVIWVEGINWASTLAGVPILKGANIVYTFHHPGSPHPDASVIPGPKIWWESFGYLAAEGYHVLDGEFANYIGNYYWDVHPGPSVRAYLTYLQDHHIGLLCWSLVAGSLNANGDYESMSQEPQGDGHIIRAFFRTAAIKARLDRAAK